MGRYVEPEIAAQAEPLAVVIAGIGECSRARSGFLESSRVVEDVEIEYDQPAENPWVVTAPRGEIQVDWQTLRLEGGVRMVFEDGSDPPVILATPDVLLEASEHLASTASDVRLQRGEHQVTATGMSVDLKGGLVRLESQVHGRFLP